MSEGRDYFRGFIKGYEEGLNRAWEDLIGLTTRGYSPREIQVMAKSKRQSVGQLVRDMKETIRDETGVDLTAPVQAPTSDGVQAGKGYLVEAQSLNKAVAVFRGIVAQGSGGMVISRRYPGDIQPYLPAGVEMYWLTRQENTSQGVSFPCLSPSDTGRIASTVSKFMKDGPNRVVMLEGTEYLIMHNNDFSQVGKFLHGLIDQTVSSGSVLLIPINPAAMEERQLRALESIAYVISA